jgi:hypothetical protein
VYVLVVGHERMQNARGGASSTELSKPFRRARELQVETSPASLIT